MSGESIAPGEEGLKPCPFCGRKPEIGTYYDNDPYCPCTGDCGFPLIEWQNAYCWKEISTLREALTKEKERNAELESLCREFGEAAKGLSFGEDWNNGTHAKLHGYRQKLLDALAKYTALLGGEGKDAIRSTSQR